MKNEILNKCQKQQINLLKTVSKSYRCFPIGSYQSVICNYDNIQNNECKYDIVNIIYEYCKRAAYIIKISGENTKYFMKIKSKDLDNYNEIEVFNYMISLYHPNIIKFIEYYETPVCYNFIYEYINGVNLDEYIKKLKLNDNIIKDIMLHIISAVKFLHDNKIIHCDLKMDNIVVSSDGNIKLIDFDLARICNNSMECITDVVIGTDGYIAPESYDLCIYSPKSDVWSIGVILHIMITNKFPFDNSIDESNMYRRNKFKHLDIKPIKSAIEINNYSPEFIKLIKRMLKFNDNDRIGLIDINLKIN